ncbi:hypothetical protein J1N35_042072 [Gossypium stocksii]|uniref:RRM domain-containing protein n=1 Tax=Gossypium stocksii TaxID=47602 RepID=A0A9D3UH15_9ROSI|nr:hypothetical protein J1N35_042072 [Gossypium stocksii]
MNQMKPKPKIKAPAPTINPTTKPGLSRAAAGGGATKIFGPSAPAGEGVTKLFGPSAPTGGEARETTVLGPLAGTEEAFEALVTEVVVADKVLKFSWLLTKVLMTLTKLHYSLKHHVALFVHKIPATMHWKGLWTLFRYHGEVIDAVFLAKKSKNGSKFGFMRFYKMVDAEKAINRLNGFVILGNRISVYLARFKGMKQVWRKVFVKGDSNQNIENHKEGMVSGKKEMDIGMVVGEISNRSRDDLSLKEVMDGKGKNQVKLIKGHVDDEQLWELQKCLVGETTTFCEMKSLTERIV